MTTDQKLDMLIGAFHDFGQNIDNRLNSMEQRMYSRMDKMDKRLNSMEQRMSTMVTKDELDKRLRDTENTILIEVDRVHEIAIAMNEKTSKRIESIENQLRANCLANSTVDILLGKVTIMEKDIAILKRKIS